MLDQVPTEAFPRINAAYGAVFRSGRLSLGLVVPLEAYKVGAEPSMARHMETAQLADRLGFSGLWLRDLPFNVPSLATLARSSTRLSTWVRWRLRRKQSHSARQALSCHRATQRTSQRPQRLLMLCLAGGCSSVSRPAIAQKNTLRLT